jgi:hypothetical protein
MAPRDASAAAAASTPATRPSHDSSDPHEFEWSYTEEPHMSRRMKVLAAHPEVRRKGGDPDLPVVPFFPYLARPAKDARRGQRGRPFAPSRVCSAAMEPLQRGVGAGEAWRALGGGGG